MTTRNPLVRINGKIVDLPAADSIGGASPGVDGADGAAATISVGSTTTGAAGSSASVTNSGSSSAAVLDFTIPRGDTGANGTGSGANFICNGRLTLTSGTAVTTSDVTGATTVYFTPFGGNQISTYDSSVWTGHQFTELSLALGTLTSGKNYDVFIYNNSGTLTLELSAAWTSDTARNDAIALQDGVYVKSSDHSRRYLGTFRTTSTTTTEDSAAKRYLYNHYNQAPRPMVAAAETANSWTYSTASWRQANANSANQLDFVCGDAATYVEVVVMGIYSNSSGNTNAAVGVGVNSTSVNSAQIRGAQVSASVLLETHAYYRGYPGLGRNFLAWLEIGAGTGTQTWYGDANVPTVYQMGPIGTVWL